MQQQHVNQEHSQHKPQQHQTQEQQLTRSEELLQQLHQQVQHQQQELQKLQQRNPCNHQSQPLQDRHANLCTVSNEKRNIVIFGDSIPKGILGQKLFNAKVFYRFFPGATSRDFFHYIKPTLQDPETNFDIAVLHMGVNDILNLGSTGETVLNSILHIANLCINYGVKEVSISSVTCTTLLNSYHINDVNNTLRNKCQTSGYHFIDNNNITTEKLWKERRLTLNKGIIINNFVQSLNSSNFLIKQLNRQILS